MRKSADFGTIKTTAMLDKSQQNLMIQTNQSNINAASPKNVDIKAILNVVKTMPTLRQLQIVNRRRMKHFCNIAATKNITRLSL